MRTDSRDTSSPTKVAIVGGGCAALSAAYELTRPELGERFSVTVYQMGWRLGGKGASGRGVSGRIEEHGLHLWMGYYENAFRLMRECYRELKEAPDNQFPWSFEDAFAPANHNGAMDWSLEKGWLRWKVRFPVMPGLPGDPNPPIFSVSDYLVHAAHMLRTLLATLPLENPQPQPFPSLQPSLLTPEELGSQLSRLAKYATVAGVAAAIEGLSWIESLLTVLPRFPQQLVDKLVSLVTESARAELSRMTRSDDEVRRLWEVAELILATIRGSIRFRLITDPRGFDAIDEYDCREWLKLNGASEEATNSAFIRALYDLAFAFEAGDPSRPAIAAGSAIRGALRAFFSYRGAFFWKMNAGMGDVVFAPLYEVLRRRGVRFEFFHKLTSLELSPTSEDPPHVTALKFDVQARTLSGGEYRPLCSVKGLPSWPSRPLFEQLARAQELQAAGVDLESQWDRRLAEHTTLRVGRDFDFVVLGVALGVIPTVCESIIERDEKWQAMVERVKSVPTQAFQLWLDRDARQLGWEDEAVNVSGFVEPFDTWADLTHLAAVEDWPTQPQSVAYFCNVLPESELNEACHDDFVARARDRVRSNCVAFLERDARHLWPGAVTPSGHFRWDALVCSPQCSFESTSGADRFRTQYWTANVRPSDRYSQALPGTTRHRISPLDRTYDNLTVAGDWTSCGINMGCVEAAVISGMLAAHALSGHPALEQIVGYDHP